MTSDFYLPLYDFPNRFTAAETDALGSIDEVTWFSGDASGTDTEAVPANAVLFVRGWAANLDRSAEALAALVRLDGSITYEARVGLPRPDVAGVFDNRGFERCGFEAVVPTGSLTPGRHTLDVCVVEPDHLRYGVLAAQTHFTLMPPLNVLPDLPFEGRDSCGAFDLVSDDWADTPLVVDRGMCAVPRGTTLRIRGWLCAKDPYQTFDELFFVSGTIGASVAETEIRRADVASELGDANLELCGFEGCISLRPLPLGEHAIDIVGRIGDRLISTTLSLRIVIVDMLPVRVPLPETTVAAIDDVVPVSDAGIARPPFPVRLMRGDRLRVRGWAVDSAAGSIAGGVVLLIDGEKEIRTLYGLERPDVAESLRDDGLLRCGFTAEIRAAELAVGMHVAECLVLARDMRGALRANQRFSFEVYEDFPTT